MSISQLQSHFNDVPRYLGQLPNFVHRSFEYIIASPFESPFFENFRSFGRMIKQEAPAITVLFFGALGIFPAWFSLALAVGGIAKIVWSLSEANVNLTRLNDAQLKIGQLTDSVRTLKGQFNDANALLAATTQEKNNLSLELFHAKNQEVIARKDLESANSRINHLSQVTSLEDRILALQAQQAGPNGKIQDGQRKQIQGLIGEVTALRERTNELEQSLQSLQQERDRSAAEKLSLQKELSICQATNPILREEWTQIQRQILSVLEAIKAESGENPSNNRTHLLNLIQKWKKQVTSLKESVVLNPGMIQIFMQELQGMFLCMNLILDQMEHIFSHHSPGKEMVMAEERE